MSLVESMPDGHELITTIVEYWPIASVNSSQNVRTQHVIRLHSSLLVS